MVERVAVELAAKSVRASSTFDNRAAAFCNMLSTELEKHFNWYIYIYFLMIFDLP